LALGQKIRFLLKPAQPAFLSFISLWPSWRPSVPDRPEAFVLTVPRQRPSRAQVPPMKNPPLTSSPTESAPNQNRKHEGLESASFKSCEEENPYIKKLLGRILCQTRAAAFALAARCRRSSPPPLAPTQLAEELHRAAPPLFRPSPLRESHRGAPPPSVSTWREKPSPPARATASP
jgi:hypothetical protein